MQLREVAETGNPDFSDCKIYALFLMPGSVVPKRQMGPLFTVGSIHGAALMGFIHTFSHSDVIREIQSGYPFFEEPRVRKKSQSILVSLLVEHNRLALY